MQILKDKSGKTSMMRVAVMLSMIIGSIVSIAGTVAMFYNIPAAGTAITAGLTLIGSGGWAKSFQRKYENDGGVNAPSNNTEK